MLQGGGVQLGLGDVALQLTAPDKHPQRPGRPVETLVAAADLGGADGRGLALERSEAVAAAAAGGAWRRAGGAVGCEPAPFVHPVGPGGYQCRGVGPLVGVPGCWALGAATT